MEDDVSNLYIDAAYSPTSKKAGWAANFTYKINGVEKRIVFYSSLSPPYNTHNCAETLAALYAIYIVLSTNVVIKRLNIHLDSYYAMRLLYKHYRNLLYFPGNLYFSENFIKHPNLTFFPVEEHYMDLVKKLQTKLVSRQIDIGIFHVKSHVERHPINPRNRHQENNNKTDFYAKVAREAAENGTPIKLLIVNEGNQVVSRS